MILERDKRIDDETASGLRADVHCDWRRSAAPCELPYPIVIDQDALLARALHKCPRRESLSLERQLELAKADLDEVRNPDWSRGSRDDCVNPDGLREVVLKMREWIIKELEQQIVAEASSRAR